MWSSIYPELTGGAFAFAVFGAFCLGFSKTGFPGLAMVNVLIIAELFGAKASVGIILPLLVLCDFIIYPLYRKYASWVQVWPLIVPTLIGVVLGWLLLDAISNHVAGRLLGGIVLFMAFLQLARQWKSAMLTSLPDAPFFRWGSGLIIGVATMLANAAGSVYAIYALVRQMSKSDFLGVGARLFLLVNVLKLPFSVNLGILNANSLRLDTALVPGVLLGICVGRQVIARIPEALFQGLLYAFSFIAGVRLLFF